jgi:hypothetical protein
MFDMIHFDFVVDDVDAENIMAALQNEVWCSVESALSTDNEIMIRAYKDTAEYYRGLIIKMKNTRV